MARLIRSGSTRAYPHVLILRTATADRRLYDFAYRATVDIVRIQAHLLSPHSVPAPRFLFFFSLTTVYALNRSLAQKDFFRAFFFLSSGCRDFFFLVRVVLSCSLLTTLDLLIALGSWQAQPSIICSQSARPLKPAAKSSLVGQIIHLCGQQQPRFPYQSCSLTDHPSEPQESRAERRLSLVTIPAARTLPASYQAIKATANPEADINEPNNVPSPVPHSLARQACVQPSCDQQKPALFPRAFSTPDIRHIWTLTGSSVLRLAIISR